MEQGEIAVTLASILVVEDESEIREPLIAYLRRYGFEAQGAADAPTARAHLTRGDFDLVLLDVMLPSEDGYALCRELQDRGRPGIPVIFLTALNELPDKVAGLELGADDYVTKPFEPRELVARIRTVLRRKADDPSASGSPLQDDQSVQATLRYVFGAWTFDIDRRKLLRDGSSITLTVTEFELLRAFVEHPKIVLSRERLATLTQRGEDITFERSVDSRVTRLRRKIEDNPAEPTLIQTEWGIGYMFCADVRRLAPSRI